MKQGLARHRAAIWLCASLLAAVLGVTGIAAVPSALAQTGKNAKPAATSSTDWKNLTPVQRQILQPLQKDWHRLDTFRREKWLELANRFATMSPADQARMQERMRDWAALSPEQRKLAREHYQRVKKLNVEKNRRWEQYQQLPEERKKELADSAPTKKRLTNPPRAKSSPSKPAAATSQTPATQAASAVPPAVETPAATPPVQPYLPQAESLPVQSSPSSP